MSVGTSLHSLELQVPNYNEKIPSELQKRLQSCRTLPSVPVVVFQVLDMVQNIDDIDVGDLVKVVTRDPAVAAKIMKVANSSWCGVSREVTTLEQAIVLLGLSGTLSLALSFSLVRKGEKSDKGFDYKKYWRRAVISAAATVETGLLMKAAHRDVLFLAGLLQDIGVLVLSESLPEYGRLTAPVQYDHNALLDVEHRELQTDHALVGAWFLQRWGLPETLISAITNSHNYSEGSNQINSSVALGSLIADIWINPEDRSRIEDITDAAESLFAMSREQLNEILTRTAESFPKLILDFDIELINEFEVNRLLDQSREAIAEINVQMVREARGLASQAQRDSLTSLYNRSYLSQILDNQFARSVNLCQPLTAIFIDVDHFKQINDTCGHAGGDVVLVEIAKTIQAAVRNYDTVVRFGGDEFIALLANASDQIGAEVAERIRAQVADKLYDVGDGEVIRATVSIGYATMHPGSEMKEPKELLAAADKNLYIAKHAGRNRVA